MIDQKVKPDRRHELDWLRAFAILVLLFFHTGRIFDTQAWHIKNNETSDSFDYWLPFISTWRMPLLFLISGAGSFFAFRKSSSIHFIVERFKRLIIPLAFATVIVLPVQAYYEHKAEFINYWDFYKSVLNFIPYYNGNPNLYHLWFLGHLFVYSLIAVPILMFLRSPQSRYLKSRTIHPLAVLLLPPVIPIITKLMFLPDYPGRGLFAFYLSFFLFGMVFYFNSDNRDLIYKSRTYSLTASFLMLILYGLSFGYQETYLFHNITVPSLHEIASVFVGWFWLMTLLGYAQRYLNHSNRWLVVVNEGIFSFYILHQTIIVAFGYYICQLSWSIAAKFWTINFLTLLFCVVFYLLLIRPFNVVRFCFGMNRRVKSDPNVAKSKKRYVMRVR